MLRTASTPGPAAGRQPVRGRAGLGLAVAVSWRSLTAIRLIGLKYSTVDLFFDESQYWAWSRELAFGYFSKPPLLAWIIAAAEQVCGSSEACIRAPAPILYFGTSLLVYAVARQLYDRQVAFFAALSIGACDRNRILRAHHLDRRAAPVLLGAGAARLCEARRPAADARWTIVLGLALGLGLMAKYAMIYFVLGVALAAWLDPDARKLLRTPAPWLALADRSSRSSTPNILWNLDNGLATFRHTGDNIQGGGVAFDPRKGLEFILRAVRCVRPGRLCRAAGRVRAHRLSEP